MAEQPNFEQASTPLNKKSRGRYSVRNRLLLSFVFVALISTILLTVATVYLQFQGTQKSAFEKLEAIANLKEGDISTWVNSLVTNIITISANNQIRQSMVGVLNLDPPTGPDYPLSYEQTLLINQLTIYTQQNSSFDDVFLVDLKGDVLASSDLSYNNISRVRSEYNLFKDAVNGPTNSQVIRESSSDYQNSSVIIVAVPIKNYNDETIGILAGRASITKLYDILAKLSGLGRTGETYLVGADQKMVTATRFMPWKPYYYMTTDGVKASLNQVNGYKTYSNYQFLPVFGVYHWIPSLQVVLLAEMNQSEAYEPAILIVQTNFLAALIAILIAAVGSIFVANSIAIPINALVNVAKQIASGDLSLKARVNREDEIGDLAIAFNSMTDQLKFLIRDLEQRVNARTAELERRTIQIKAAGEVARDITIAEDLNELLNRSVNLIRERFGYYHAGIFLADEHGDYAILKAATGEAGRLMVEQEHRLKIGEIGIVGNVVGSGAPRIASDVGEDSLHFKNPLLPETHSEMALPLKIGGEVIGALDVQSQLISAFSKEDIDILQTMADQLAVAIQRARLVQRLEENIQELQTTYQNYTRDAWHDFLRKSRKTYHLRYQKSVINQAVTQNPEAKEALIKNETIVKSIEAVGQKEDGPTTAVAIPIQLRGYILGVVNLQFQAETVNPDIVTLIENISSRLALSLDNARLLMEIRRRAEREHRISEITSKVRASTEIDKILRMAVEELGQVIGVSGAVIQLRTNDNRKDPS